MKMHRTSLAAASAAACLGLAVVQPAAANDHMFPAATAAKPFIDYDTHGFLINGKRTFLVSAGLEYARVPRAQWRDRLLRLKRAGFNCVEVYTFWNWHEPQEGKFNFSGDHDLDAFFKLVHEMGMYAIARVGPYYCAEWEGGGYPTWLHFKPGLEVRKDNPEFEKCVDAFFDKLIPIVVSNQINHGGSVVLVQLENEHNDGWGTENLNNPYFRHLRDKAVSLGLQTPYFFSGLHHGSDPGSDKSMDDASRPNPWFTTEFWSVWYSQYGPKPNDAADYARRTWKIIAHGGGGYNYYMAYGGTNFAYTNNNEDAASYDYGAAVGQAGDLRPIYYEFKRAALFARSFEEILSSARDATADVAKLSTNADVRVTARRSSAGTIVFLDNPKDAPADTHVTGSVTGATAVTLAPHEIMPIVQDYKLAPDVTLRWAPTRILGVANQRQTTNLVIYGTPGSAAELDFTTTQPVKIETGGNALASAPGRVLLRAKFSEKQPDEYIFSVGSQRIRIIAVSDTLAQRTWFVDASLPAGTMIHGVAPVTTRVVVGPAYVGDAALSGANLTLTTERPWTGSAYYPTWIFSPTGKTQQIVQPQPMIKRLVSLPLSAWQAKNASEAAAAGYDDSRWKASDQPLQMGADGDLTADAWYRTTLNAPVAGPYTLHVAGGGDRATAFVDGARLETFDVQSGEIPLNLTAGKHTLAVFTAHDGRDKLFGYVGPMDSISAKGLLGPAALQQGPPSHIGDWKFLKADNKGAVKAGPPSSDAAGWQPYKIGDDAFGRAEGFAWFETTLPKSDGGRRTLHFQSVDENATVFINGKQAAHHEGWNQAFDIPLNDFETAGSPTVVSVFIENYSNTGGIDQPVRLISSSGDQVMGWRMQGGPGAPNAKDGWSALSAGQAFDRPEFFRTTFNTSPPAATGSHAIWRVITTGLGHGSVWVNGNNLGRYPEKIPINGMYIPECWLKSGENTVVIYDEDGKRPDQVSVEAEVAASRDVLLVQAQVP